MSGGERERFEAWPGVLWHPDAKGTALCRDSEGGYFNTAVEYAWRAWQAALSSRPAVPASVERRAAYMGVEALRDEVARLKALLGEARACAKRAIDLASSYASDDPVGCLCVEDCYCKAGRVGTLKADLSRIDAALAPTDADRRGEDGEAIDAARPAS